MRPQPFLSLVIELVDRSKGLDKNRFFIKIRFVVYSLVLYKNSSTQEHFWQQSEGLRASRRLIFGGVIAWSCRRMAN